MANRFMRLLREKSDLPGVIRFVVEESIATNAAPFHAMNFRALDRLMRVRFAAVMPKKIVPARDIQVGDGHKDVIQSDGQFCGLFNH